MSYKLNPELAKIEAPVVLVVEGTEHFYESGTVLMNLTFDRNYFVDKISARDNAVVIFLKKNDKINDMNWVGEEAVSFF